MSTIQTTDNYALVTKEDGRICVSINSIDTDDAHCFIECDKLTVDSAEVIDNHYLAIWMWMRTPTGEFTVKGHAYVDEVRFI